MSRFEPFDIIAILLTVGSMGLLVVGAMLKNPEVSESAKYIIITVTSAYVGKRWQTTDKKDKGDDKKD